MTRPRCRHAAPVGSSEGTPELCGWANPIQVTPLCHQAPDPNRDTAATLVRVGVTTQALATIRKAGLPFRRTFHLARLNSFLNLIGGRYLEIRGGASANRNSF
jgi:hypothetical protein